MIVQNAVNCLSCGDLIVSKHRHDFVNCTCGAVWVDGGQDYLRRVGDFENAVELSWSLPDKLYFDCADAAGLAMDSGRNTKGIANAVMRTLREAGRVIAEGEQRILAHNPSMDEIMVEEADGTINRYKKVVE
jgi:hypothetical protein